MNKENCALKLVDEVILENQLWYVYIYKPQVFPSVSAVVFLFTSHISRACIFDYFSQCKQAAITLWVSVLKGVVCQSTYCDIFILRGNVVKTVAML